MLMDPKVRVRTSIRILQGRGERRRGSHENRMNEELINSGSVGAGMLLVLVLGL